MECGVSKVRRLLACCAALYIVAVEFLGSIANKEFLMGVSTDPCVNSGYESPLILRLLAQLTSEPFTTQNTILSISNQSNILYLDEFRVTNDDPNKASILDIRASGCYQNEPVDSLYNATYLGPIIRHALAPYPSIYLDSFVIVDCGFDGRLLGDTTVIKFYLLHHSFENYTTFMLATLNIVRPAKKLKGTGGVAMFTTTSLDALRLSVDEESPGSIQLSSISNATYFVTIGFSFPYALPDFEAVMLEDLAPKIGQWRGCLSSSSECFFFSGTTGIYRQAPDVQASFNYFYWTLPDDPLEFANLMEFVDVVHFKDNWGWFRCLIGLGISFNIAMNSAVSLIVMLNIWITKHVLWIPDVYSSIQRRATLRALLLLLDSMMYRWWFLHQWALNQGNVRKRWGGTTSFDAISHANNLMNCLGLVSTISIWLRIRTDLHIVVALFAICYETRLWLVNNFGVFDEEVNARLIDHYLENIVRSNNDVNDITGMELWTYYESLEPDFVLIFNELTWMYIALGLNLIYIFAIKILSMHGERRQVTPVNIFMPQDMSAHWARRSILYKGFSSGDCFCNRQFERYVGDICSNRYGLVAPTVDYTQQNMISISGVWLLGFVVINDQYVIRINDYSLLIINALSRCSPFFVYGYPVFGNILESQPVRIMHNDIPLIKLWRVSLAEQI